MASEQYVENINDKFQSKVLSGDIQIVSRVLYSYGIPLCALLAQSLHKVIKNTQLHQLYL